MSAIRPPRPSLTLAAAAVVALVSGCTAASPDGDPAEPGRSPSAGAASHSPSAAPLPEAADGTDLDACADADCEVLVEHGDEFAMDGGYGVDRFVVDGVDEDGLSVSGHGPGIELSGEIPPPEEGREPHTFSMNNIAVTLIALDGSSAVMDLSALAEPFVPTD
ncbi:hypothetical protein [Nocardiopsis sp. NRRL B-16309]|uniref:hypothetical protein n=1 Tax=Nocardiopsis sp. NRRL B-16309 TaxID=1519494 RepID=UPI0006AF0D8F|nr:hypothetical protein [Nocardiopsis sp. NRRL B-16309]KOX17316.1 hypothetical protein ADL05_09445 [Nocardiopsis sp. NRRL B-16309]